MYQIVSVSIYPLPDIMFLPRLLQSLQLLLLSEMVPSQTAGWRFHQCEWRWQQGQVQGNDQMEQHISTLSASYESLWNWGPSTSATSIFNAMTVIYTVIQIRSASSRIQGAFGSVSFALGCELAPLVQTMHTLHPKTRAIFAAYMCKYAHDSPIFYRISYKGSALPYI